MTNLATVTDIVQHQHPLMARVRELEGHVRELLRQQGLAELEIRRLQTVAAQAKADADQLGRMYMVHFRSQARATAGVESGVPQVIIRAEDKAHDEPPNKSDRSALYSLDTPRHKSD